MSTRTTRADDVPALGSRTSRRPPLWLLSLFLLAFATGTDDMVIAGILPVIAGDLHVSVAVSGQLVTVFALVYALSAPLTAIVTARLPRRTVLLAAAAVFIAANLGATVAPTYPALLVARIVAALAAATASPAAIAVASAAAPPGRQGRFLAILMAGLTTSLVVGVPIGSWLGGVLGWRATMLFVAVIAVSAGTGMYLTLPHLPGAAAHRLRERLAPLRRPATALALLAMVPGGAGGMMCYVYITEIVGRLGNVHGAQVAPLITVIGLSGIAGTLLAGRAIDALGPTRALALFAGGTFAALLAVALLGTAGGHYPAVLVWVVYVPWGVAAWGFGAPAQAWLLRRGGEAANELLALNNSTMFLGFSLAGGIGGAALSTGGPLAIPVAAAASMLLSLVLFTVAFALTGDLRRLRRRTA